MLVGSRADLPNVDDGGVMLGLLKARGLPAADAIDARRGLWARLAFVLAAVLLLLAAAGCGSSDTGAGWRLVTRAQIPGDQPVKQYLGTFQLGDQVRAGWDLTGPTSPPSTLTLRVVDVKTGRSYGVSVGPDDFSAGMELHTQEGMTLNLFPGQYRLYFSQRFPRSKGPGWDIKLTVQTKQSASPSS